MRTIKFRAAYKRPWGEVGIFDLRSIDWNDGLVDSEIPLNLIELMQFTGLHAKNGKEIAILQSSAG
jgi:hypothetical protein